MPPAPAAPAPPQLPTTGAPVRHLTVQDAEALALKNNPQISVYRLLSLASNQVTREQKAAYYPNVYGSLTAVEPQEGTRIAAGNLNNPIVYERAAGGLTLSQMITDFGRTNNLVATAALRAKAADMNALATADQIKLAVDEAFYNALQTLALQTVAEQTVSARQLVSDQITTLFQNKLRSQLDVSFADANLAQSKLLLLDAQNNYQAALSTLSQILGYSAQQQFELVDTESRVEAAARCCQLNCRTRHSAIGRRLPRRVTNIRLLSISRKQNGTFFSPVSTRLGWWAVRPTAAP